MSTRAASDTEKSLPELATDDTNEMLRRILAHLEKGHRKGWVEVACAIILSLATLSSAWCAYQSKLWGGVASARDAEANVATRSAAESRLTAMEIRALEAAVFIKFFEAKTQGKDDQADFFTARLRPDSKKALEAWWKTDPLTNPNAPRGPFVMAEYTQPELEEARQQDQLATEAHRAGHAAGRSSDTYVLLTVLFASVLFFGGIAGTFESRRLRSVVLTIALALFLTTFSVLATMPIAWG